MKAYFCLQLETYWSYELCHGRHVKQFHEVKAGVPSMKVQEYYLGKLAPKVIHPMDKGWFVLLTECQCMEYL